MKRHVENLKAIGAAGVFTTRDYAERFNVSMAKASAACHNHARYGLLSVVQFGTNGRKAVSATFKLA